MSKQTGPISNINKIAILGLADAGKTSFIKILLQELDLTKKVLPTKSIERTAIEILNKELLVWDFGGHESYRKQYLATPKFYFIHV